MRASRPIVRFRCAPGDVVWHWQPSCGLWPTLVYAAEPLLPEKGRLCSECADIREQQIAA